MQSCTILLQDLHYTGKSICLSAKTHLKLQLEFILLELRFLKTTPYHAPSSTNRDHWLYVRTGLCVLPLLQSKQEVPARF